MATAVATKKPATKKQAKPVATKEAPKVEAKPVAKPAPARDKLGAKVSETSQVSKINACLSSKPIQPAAIAEKTGLSVTRCSSHCRWLLARGKLVHSEQGYAIAK